MTLHLSEVHHIMEETQMNRDTYEKIVALRLPGMAKTYLEVKKRPHYIVSDTNREDMEKVK